MSPRSLDVPMTPRKQPACGRGGKPQQIELFGDPMLVRPMTAPTWQDLPIETQSTLTSLMARLILEHVRAKCDGSQREAVHDL